MWVDVTAWWEWRDPRQGITLARVKKRKGGWWHWETSKPLGISCYLSYTITATGNCRSLDAAKRAAEQGSRSVTHARLK